MLKKLHSSKIYDLIGIGFGPANIALAIGIEELYPEKDILFVDTRKEIVWQEEMLFENALDVYSNIQNSPYRDLATPRNPCSRYTFLNYLHENGLFWKQLNLNMSMPLRPDFANYIAWCAKQFQHQFKGDTYIVNVSAEQDCYVLETADGERLRAKNIALGTGRPANIPASFQAINNPNCIHFTTYKTAIERMAEEKIENLAIVGSSQTAAEIVLQVTKMYPDINVDVIMRRFGFPLKDTTPFVSEIYFPEFTDLYFNADDDLKRRIDRDVYGTNYGTADEDVITEIYQQIYYDTLANRNKLTLHRLSTIENVREVDKKIELKVSNAMEGESFTKSYDGVILATGFQNYGPRPGNMKIPRVLEGVKDLLTLKDDAIQVCRRYNLELADEAPGEILMNGLCEETHGMGDAGSISLMAIRAKDIAERAFKVATKDPTVGNQNQQQKVTAE